VPNRKCEKCRRIFFWNGKDHSIQTKHLCSSCATKWDRFFHLNYSKNRQKFEKLYPNSGNSLYEAFLHLPFNPSKREI